METKICHLSLQFICFLNPLTTTRATIVAHAFYVITRQPLQLESCSNPPQMQQVFLVLLKKNMDLGEGFAWQRLANGGVFVFLTNFDGSWTPTHKPKYWLKLFLETR